MGKEGTHLPTGKYHRWITTPDGSLWLKSKGRLHSIGNKLTRGLVNRFIPRELAVLEYYFLF